MQCLSAADAAIQPFKPYLVSSLPDNLSSKASLCVQCGIRGMLST